MKNSGIRKYAAVAAILLLLAGCSSDGGAPKPPATASQAPSDNPGDSTPAITIKGFGFEGPSSVPPGATVTVTNLDSADHTVTADDGTSFDVTVSGGGGTATFTAPTGTGSFDYHCTFHPTMHGTLVVEGGS